LKNIKDIRDNEKSLIHWGKLLDIPRKKSESDKDYAKRVLNFLMNDEKNCLSEYVGTELSLKRGKKSIRADVFGVSNQDDPIIYLCEGKKELN